jgi:hypothetical protein
VRSLSRYSAIVAGILGIFVFAIPGPGSTVVGISLLLAVGGVSAQSVLRDVIAGTMMLSERWFDVGDAITIEPWGMSGIVETISLRSVKLRGLDDREGRGGGRDGDAASEPRLRKGEPGRDGVPGHVHVARVGEAEGACRAVDPRRRRRGLAAPALRRGG